MISRPTRLACLALVLIGVAGPAAASAQRRSEVEVERHGSATLSRLELYDAAFPLLRVEREREDSSSIHRVGVQIPGRAASLDGYLSLFLEDRPDRTGVGAAFEVGRGAPMLGGSVERDEHRFTGAYFKLRAPNLEVAFGGGRRDDAWVQHGGIYAKGVRWSVALGGAHGEDGVDLEHIAATWHPAQRGGGPGARFIAERRTAEQYQAELMVADRANFNHLTVWGQYGMDQWPHRKTFEVADDIMRYVRPPIFQQQYTTGIWIVRGRYEVRDDAGRVTLDGRTYPTRLVLRPVAGAPPRAGARGYLVDRVLPTIMLGAVHRTNPGQTTLVGQIDFPPVSIYGEASGRTGPDPYLFVQLRRPFPW